MAPTNQEKCRGQERVNPLAESCLVPIAQRGACQEETADSCLLLSQREEEADTLLRLQWLAEKQAWANDQRAAKTLGER